MKVAHESGISKEDYRQLNVGLSQTDIQLRLICVTHKKRLIAQTHHIFRLFSRAVEVMAIGSDRFVSPTKTLLLRELIE